MEEAGLGLSAVVMLALQTNETVVLWMTLLRKNAYFRVTGQDEKEPARQVLSLLEKAHRQIVVVFGEAEVTAGVETGGAGVVREAEIDGGVGAGVVALLVTSSGSRQMHFICDQRM